MISFHFSSHVYCIFLYFMKKYENIFFPRGKGAVIIVSSATTDEPIPQLTLFGATKVSRGTVVPVSHPRVDSSFFFFSFQTI